MKILFICTGGTIDKDYAQKAKTYNFEIAEPAVRRVLERVNPNFDFEIKSILKKDSLDMTDEDRQKVFDAVKEVSSKKIIITHGTDPMTDTAKKLSEIKDKAIILVGSSKPEKFYDSDAPFNIGIAIGAISQIQAGVYIAMNGKVYEYDKVQKVQDTGQFVEK
jgi:L-asparaginase